MSTQRQLQRVIEEATQLLCSMVTIKESVKTVRTDLCVGRINSCGFNHLIKGFKND